MRSAESNLRLDTGPDLACAIDHAAGTGVAHRGTISCSTLVALGGVLYGPKSAPDGLDPEASFTPVSQTRVDGSGSANDPSVVTTVVDLGSSGVRLTQTDTFAVGGGRFQTTISIDNSGPLDQAATIYRVGDCRSDDVDTGFGASAVEYGAVGCAGANADGDGPNDGVFWWRPSAASVGYSSFMEGEAADVWSRVMKKQPLSNTTQSGTHVDNAAGLSWHLSVPAGGSVEVGDDTGHGLLDESPDVMFVHGITANAQDLGDDGWELFVDELAADYPGRALRFEYFQDRAFEDGGGDCDPLLIRPLMTPAPSNGNMPTILDGSDPEEYCDSQSDLALNAVKLHDEVVDHYATTGDKVVIVAHSMGAAVVRGFLTYSDWQGVGADYVDSVIFVAGAHDGSFLAGPLTVGLSIASYVGDLNPLSELMPLDGARPAAHGLTTQSDWYEWANLNLQLPGDVPYYNFYGDLQQVTVTCGLFVLCDEGPPTFVGDGVMLRGTNDPFDVPAEGGARFLPTASSPAFLDVWQWTIDGELSNCPDPPWCLSAHTPFAGGDSLSKLADHEVAHWNLASNLATVMVANCVSGDPTELHDELMRLIDGRMTGDPYECGETT